jgi:hypothetical protein
MKVLSPDEERILNKLLEFAGSSGLLEKALIRARAEKGESTALEDVLRQITRLKAEQRQPLEHQPV